ncbi:DNase I-like protein, partial [Coemansia reversa NRRL 1564]
KEAWIADSLKKRQNEFVDGQKIRAFVGTWNVNGRAAAETSELSEWLGFVPTTADEIVDITKIPELVVVGFQELDARAEAFVYNDAVKDIEWTEAIERAMGGARGVLEKVASRQLIGMFLLVYVRTDVRKWITEVQTTAVGCGIMGVVGNKGAVAVRLMVQNTMICLVCAHLAHDAAQVDRRNAQFHDLCRRLQFGEDTVFDHNYVIWLGDLNYRLDTDAVTVARALKSDESHTLLAFDQLQRAQMQRQAFVGFEEAAIGFAPTYKLVVGAKTYDLRRQPAWCDRVLWWMHAGNEGGVRNTEYTSIDTVCTSDHRPVRAMLEIGIWRVDVERRRTAFLQVLRELDRAENECIPTATLVPASIEFGAVYFGQVERRKLHVANTGHVPLEFSFVATPIRAKSAAPEWLHIAPAEGMLLPGQSTNVQLTVAVDQRTSAVLSRHAAELQDILVLHLRGGRDYFVQVQGSYQTSVFGMELEVLVHCKSAVRDMSPGDFERCLQSGRLSVPRCVWRMSDFLTRFGTDRGLSLFSHPGDAALVGRIREWLDHDQELDPAEILQGVDSVATCLVEFFGALPAPLIPAELYAACIEAGALSRAAALEAVEELAPANLTVLVYLLAFLRDAVERGAASARRVARVFAVVLLRAP